MTTAIPELTDGAVEISTGEMHFVEKGSGAPVILVHGYAPISSWRVWQANIDALATVRRVIAVDLPGYADSAIPPEGKPTDFEEWFSTYARCVHELIESLELAPAAVCGLSAGGAACLTLAVKWPDDVERIILVDSAGSQALERWRGLQKPALLIWQREDRLTPLPEGRKLHEAIPGSRLEILEGNDAGIEPHDWHWSQALNPDRFNRLALEFLKG